MAPEGVAVLRMHVVRAGGVDYYVRDLVPGRSEGTGVAGESPGVWTGRGSAVLGVRGSVGPGEFTEVLAGRDPQGERSLRTTRGPRAVSGVDLLFCAPKSVSLLHLLGPSELSEATGAAHLAAVADALTYLERVGLGVRRTRAGVTTHLATTGAVAAGFVHRTSRSLDPHVHTHLVTANVAQGVDGAWTSIDTCRLFRHRRPLEALYDASLRRELSDRLGVAWERGPTGRWDIAGVDPVLCRLFSRRTASIDEQVFRAGAGTGTSGRRRVAFHVDRPAKEVGPTVDGLRSEWRRRAADHDLDPADLVRVVGRARALPTRVAVEPDELAGRLTRHSVHRTSLGTRDLVALVADSAPSGLRVDDVEVVAGALGRAATVAAVRRNPDLAGRWTDLTAARWVVADVRDGLSSADRLVDGVLVDPASGRRTATQLERPARQSDRALDRPGGGGGADRWRVGVDRLDPRERGTGW